MSSYSDVKMLGVTPPISMDPPKPEDLRSSETLLSNLISLNQFESEQEHKVRERLLSNIAQLVSKFVHDVSIKAGLSEKVASEAGGRIYTSGSYRLGVHGPGSDIDTICVCPRHVYKEHFFGEFKEMLRAWPAVTEISAVESAFVPVMKTVISGVEVDLLFARLNLPEAGDKLDIEKDEILRGVDDASQRSLNGPRVTDMMLNLVPDVATFRTALRTIRLWARNRGIYGNVLGFPGGVAYALLTARICQLYPTAAPSTIVAKFFPIFYQWGWPQPVMLKKIESGPSNMQHPVWNPKVDRKDMLHRMPVITPAYPSMCSTHNITASTMSVIKTEMFRAIQITEKILANPGSPWNELFEKVDFFSMYKTYVQVVASASSAEGIKDWGGTVESRLRTLVQDLENTENILTAHPSMKGISNVFICLTEEEQAAASQGDLGLEAMKRKEEDYIGKIEVVKGEEGVKLEDGNGNGNGEGSGTGGVVGIGGKGYRKIWTKNFFIGLEIEKRPKDGGSRVLNLFYPSKRFCAACQGWDKYDEQEMSVILRPAKRSELPFYCFPDGIPKGKKKGKRAVMNGSTELTPEDTADGQGPSKRPKSIIEESGTSNISTLTPALDQLRTLPILSDPSILQPNGPDPTPGGIANEIDVDLAPPPGIEGMKPLSASVMSSFASAASGVVEVGDVGKDGGEGKVVLSGSS